MTDPFLTLKIAYFGAQIRDRPISHSDNSRSAKLEYLMVEASRKKSPGRVTRKQFNI